MKFSEKTLKFCRRKSLKNDRKRRKKQGEKKLENCCKTAKKHGEKRDESAKNEAFCGNNR